MLLNLLAWVLAIVAAVLFFTGVVGFIAPSLFKLPDEDMPPSRLKFLLAAWLAPVLPGAIALTIWMMKAST